VEVNAEELARFFDRVLPHLNERQRRVVAGAAAHLVGNKTASRLRQPISLTPPRDFATAGPGPLPSAGPLSVAITFLGTFGAASGGCPLPAPPSEAPVKKVPGPFGREGPYWSYKYASCASDEHRGCISCECQIAQGRGRRRDEIHVNVYKATTNN
jgi:hypothetical protein